ncbi:MAG: serine hydrolase domain-containing protein, partial [Hyphomonadaceae bacterium]
MTGLSLALVAGGRLLWAEGFGWADREAQRPVTSSTSFAIASTTKTFTTAAMMAMVEDGHLDLDAPANKYLAPDNLFDDAGPVDEVTLRRLASHTAGLPTFFLMYPDDEAVSPPSVSELLRDYGHLVAPPG